MLYGLMQDRQLQISSILTYAAAAHSSREVVSRLVSEPLWRYTYSGLAERSAQVAHALAALGIRGGDRISTLAWNTHRHLEIFYGATGFGVVVHTANPRLHDDQLVFTLNNAGAQVLFYDETFDPVIRRLSHRLPLLRAYVRMSREAGDVGDGPTPLGYESLIAEQPCAIDWPVFDERAGAFLCYTSGTTGEPKGVLYSHRSVVLHAMGAGLPSAFGFTPFDVVMPCSSLYHATAWGLPFVAPLAGAKLVFPCERMDGEALHALIEAEGVTFTGGVPTIWTNYLNWLEQHRATPASLKRVVIGGSAVPRAMAEAFLERYGVEVLQIWGMTETCPLGVVATPTPALAARGEAAMRDTIWSRQGRLQFGIELKVVDDEGQSAPADGESSGALKVRGPWVLQRYYGAEADAVDAEGWFDTGDVATLDPDGFMRITDRAKDLIKSGGEWISSIDLENAASAAAGVRTAAVVGLHHPVWEERPILIVEPHEGRSVSAEDVMAVLALRFAKWQLPDAVVIAEVPMTATGKIDKKRLRAVYADFFASVS